MTIEVHEERHRSSVDIVREDQRQDQSLYLEEEEL